jgi:integrase
MKTKKRDQISYPFVQSTPFGKIKIYRSSDRYVVSWIDAEKGRMRQTFTEEVQAHQRAEELIEDLEKGVSFRNQITATKAVRISQYEAELKKHNATLGDAVAYYLAHLEKRESSKIDTLEAVNRYLAQIDDQKGRHYRTAKHVLFRFARAHVKTLDSITVPELDKYVREISDVGRTRNNHLCYLGTFYKWAQEYGNYVPEGKLITDKIKRFDEKATDIQLFTPDEIEKLLRAGDRLMPYIAIGAFAGVRSSEIERLTWDDLDFESNTIHLSSSVTKTKRRRLALMSDNLIQWLNSYTGEKKGSIIPEKFQFQWHRASVCETAGVTWKPNALRKSYISYRMAQEDADAAKVAKQCGNSPAMVEEHYKGLVSPKVAEKWFAVTP